MTVVNTEIVEPTVTQHSLRLIVDGRWKLWVANQPSRAKWLLACRALGMDRRQARRFIRRNRRGNEAAAAVSLRLPLGIGSGDAQ